MTTLRCFHHGDGIGFSLSIAKEHGIAVAILYNLIGGGFFPSYRLESGWKFSPKSFPSDEEIAEIVGTFDFLSFLSEPQIKEALLFLISLNGPFIFGYFTKHEHKEWGFLDKRERAK